MADGSEPVKVPKYPSVILGSSSWYVVVEALERLGSKRRLQIAANIRRQIEEP